MKSKHLKEVPVSMKKHFQLVRRLCTLLLSIPLFLSCSLAEESGLPSSDYAPLFSLAEPFGFKLGGCFGAWDMQNAGYMDFIARHFNSLTCTNETKAYSLLNQVLSRKSEDGMPRMDYSTADRMIAFCQEHQIQVRGHVLVWDAYMTPWFFHEGYDEKQPIASVETMRARLASYIDQVISHFEEKFPGVIYCWDVVNEAIGDSSSEYNAADPRHLRTSRSGASNCFLDYVGDDYVAYSFLCAKDTVERLGADIRLFYNDYNMFQPDKRAAALALAESVNTYAKDENGTPRKLMDGIGMQGYLGGYGSQDGCLDSGLLTALKESINLYASHGFEVQLTEMAVRNYEKEKAQEHAAFYGRLFEEVFMAVNSAESAPLSAVCIWGISDCPQLPRDHYTWKLNSPYGGLITEKNQIKTSFDTVYHVLQGK